MKLYGNVTSITRIKQLSAGLDYLKIVIDFDENSLYFGDLYWFYDYQNAMDFLNKKVECEIRQDVYEGEVIDVVANVANYNVIQVLAAEDNIKLIPARDNTHAVCNLDIATIRQGDYLNDQVMYLADFTTSASSHAKWVDCICIDKFAKSFKLRLFTTKLEGDIDIITAMNQWKGHYIMANIRSTPWGFQTDEIQLYNVTVVAPPEVDIAYKMVEKEIAADEELREYVQKYDFLDYLKSVIYYEAGYHLVYIAAEINIIKATCNITNEYDMQSMIRAAICSRGYLLPRKTALSRTMLNCNKILSTQLVKDKELLLILDAFAEEEASATKKAYIEIKRYVKKILDNKRGEAEYEESTVSVAMSNLRNLLGGLF